MMENGSVCSILPVEFFFSDYATCGNRPRFIVFSNLYSDRCFCENLQTGIRAGAGSKFVTQTNKTMPDDCLLHQTLYLLRVLPPNTSLDPFRARTAFTNPELWRTWWHFGLQGRHRLLSPVSTSLVIYSSQRSLHGGRSIVEAFARIAIWTPRVNLTAHQAFQDSHMYQALWGIVCRNLFLKVEQNVLNREKEILAGTIIRPQR